VRRCILKMFPPEVT